MWCPLPEGVLSKLKTTSAKRLPDQVVERDSIATERKSRTRRSRHSWTSVAAIEWDAQQPNDAPRTVTERIVKLTTLSNHYQRDAPTTCALHTFTQEYGTPWDIFA